MSDRIRRPPPGPAGLPGDQAEHTRRTRAAYDRLAPVWSATTDDGPFNGRLERPALRSLVPRPLAGRHVLDAGCGSGAQVAWLLDEGATVTGVDLSPAMVAQARQRCGERARFLVGDLAGPLDLVPGSFDGVTCSLVLHYLADFGPALRTFARALHPGGWVVCSLDHPAAPPLAHQPGGYFDTVLVEDTWIKADVEVTQHFWRRPLSAVVAAFSSAGFLVEAVAEPRITADDVARHPEMAPAEAPSFIVYRLRLVGAGGPGAVP
jgi:SAM-dependent methyltransferase